MRFIGNKSKLLNLIYHLVKKHEVKGNTFFDFFSGTANVGKFFKSKGYKVYSSDLLYFSYVLQKSYIENNKLPQFDTLLKFLDLKQEHLIHNSYTSIVEYLNNLEPVKGFIYENYTPEGTHYLEIPRMYFSNHNGMKIDSIRKTIETWFSENLINEIEYYILIATLIESVPFFANTTGVYAAFSKKWDPRAVKDLKLKEIEFFRSNIKHKSYNIDSVKLLTKVKTDILYLDPPYNERQYGSNYHLLETIAKYDDPKIEGVSGMRNYNELKSDFCNKNKALIALDKIAGKGKYKTLILSYNSEGIMPHLEVQKVLSKYGKLIFEEIDYTRYKSNNNGESKTKKLIKEHLYFLFKT